MEEGGDTGSGPSTMDPESVVDAGARSLVSMEGSAIDMGQRRFDQLQTRNAELEDENRRLTRNAQSSEEKINSLQSTNRALNRDLADARQKITDAQGKIEKLETDVRQLEGKLSNEEQNKEDVQKALEEERRNRDQLDKKLGELEARQRNEAEERAASLQEPDGVSNARDDLARKQEEQRLKIAELEGAKTRAEEEAAKWRQKAEEATKAKKDLDEKLKKVEKRGGVPTLSTERLQQVLRTLSLQESPELAGKPVDLRSSCLSTKGAQFDPKNSFAEIITEVVNHWTSIHSVRELEVHLEVEPGETPKNRGEVKERVTKMLNSFLRDSGKSENAKMKALNRILRVLRINVKDNKLSDAQDTWWSRNLERLAGELPDLNNFVWFFIEYGILSQCHAEQIFDMGRDDSVPELEQKTRFLFIVRGFGKRGTQVLGESFKRLDREDLYEEIKQVFGEATYPKASPGELRSMAQLDAPGSEEERLRQQVQALEDQLAKQKEKTRKESKDRQEAQATMMDHRKERKAAETRTTRLEEQLRQSQAGGGEDGKFKKIAEEMKQEVADLNGVLKSTKEEAAKLKRELAVKKDELQAKEQELAGQKEMIEKQGNTLREKGKKEDQLRAQVEQLKKDLGKSHAFSNTPGPVDEDVVAAKEHYKKQAGELKDKNKKLQKEVEGLKAKCDKLDGNVKKMTKEIRILKAEIAGKEAQISALQGEEGAAALVQDGGRKMQKKEEQEGVSDMVAKVDKKLHKKS